MSFISRYSNFERKIPAGPQEEAHAAVRAALINSHLLSQEDAPLIMSYHENDPCVTLLEKDNPPKTYVWRKGESNFPPAIGQLIQTILGRPIDVPSLLHQAPTTTNNEHPVRLIPPSNNALDSRHSRDFATKLDRAGELMERLRAQSEQETEDGPHLRNATDASPQLRHPNSHTSARSTEELVHQSSAQNKTTNRSTPQSPDRRSENAQQSPPTALRAHEPRQESRQFSTFEDDTPPLRDTADKSPPQLRHPNSHTSARSTEEIAHQSSAQNKTTNRSTPQSPDRRSENAQQSPPTALRAHEPRQESRQFSTFEDDTPPLRDTADKSPPQLRHPNSHTSARSTEELVHQSSAQNETSNRFTAQQHPQRTSTDRRSEDAQQPPPTALRAHEPRRESGKFSTFEDDPPPLRDTADKSPPQLRHPNSHTSARSTEELVHQSSAQNETANRFTPQSPDRKSENALQSPPTASRAHARRESRQSSSASEGASNSESEDMALRTFSSTRRNQKKERKRKHSKLERLLEELIHLREKGQLEFNKNMKQARQMLQESQLIGQLEQCRNTLLEHEQDHNTPGSIPESTSEEVPRPTDGALNSRPESLLLLESDSGHP